jgi:ABC-type branched-subunit amino acid transport system substrate-binding protein
MANLRVLSAAIMACVLTASPVWAQKQYDPGVTDTQITLGHSLPLSGPASATGAVGLAEADYFKKVNAEGGVNGRKLNFLQLDDGYNPARTLEAIRRLVEQDHVFLIFATQGTPTNIAIQKYLTVNKVPQLFIGSGAGRWNDPAHFPWTIPVLPSYAAEAKIFAKYILAHKPHAKIAILYQNDDFGRDYFNGLKAGLGPHIDQLTAIQTYEATDPTVTSQVITLQSSGADAFVIAAIPAPAAQAIHKAADLGWHPMLFIDYIANSPATTLKAAGHEQSKGAISTFFVRDPNDPQWRGTKDLTDYEAWLKQYGSDLNPVDPQNVTGYVFAKLLVDVLRRCGDDLTRANVIAQTTNITNLALPMLLPGITMTYTPTEYVPFHELQLEQFDGQRYRPLGAPVSVD